MNVSLTSHLEKLVKRKVASGLYNSASEVIREALRFFEEYDRLNQRHLASLKEDIEAGLASGKPTSLNMEKVKAKARARSKKK